MYERLTERLANGGVGYSNGEYFRVCYPWNEHCLTDIDRMAIKLCELEDKIEQGKILELPCKIGDEVWINRYFHSKLLPQKGIVSEMKFLPNMELQIVVKYVGRGRWGKDIFATLEEANNKLANKHK